MARGRAEARAFCTGIGLYAYQAAQSLDRALGSDLVELREFYAGRIQPAGLARAVVKFEPLLPRVQGGVLRRIFFGASIDPIDLWIMSRLLLDFGNVLKGGNFEIEDLGCLRYCLAITSSKFLQGSGQLDIGKLSHYGRNEIVGAGVEIESILGKSWAQLG